MAGSSSSDKNFAGVKVENEAGDLHKKLIKEEREKYPRGEGRSFSWEEVKEMARTAFRQKI